MKKRNSAVEMNDEELEQVNGGMKIIITDPKIIDRLREIINKLVKSKRNSGGNDEE